MDGRNFEVALFCTEPVGAPDVLLSLFHVNRDTDIELGAIPLRFASLALRFSEFTASLSVIVMAVVHCREIAA